MRPRGRASLATVAVVAIGLVLGAVLLVSLRDDAAEADLAERCASVGRGDTADEAFAVLGLDGYRPGCGSSTPCETVDLGGHDAIPWLCDPEDCSLLWRTGEIGCFVDLDSTTLRVTEVVRMDRPGDL